MLVKFRRAQENASFKKVLREEIDEQIQQEANNEEIIDLCKERMKYTSLTDIDITVMVGFLRLRARTLRYVLIMCYSCGGV